MNAIPPFPRSSKADKDAIEQATSALTALAIEINHALDDYTAYVKTLESAMKNMVASDSSAALSDLVSTIEDLSQTLDEAETADAIPSAKSALEFSMKQSLSDPEAILKDSCVWDMTCFIENPGFDSDTHGWEGEPVWGSHVAEYWNRTFASLQTVEGLRNGDYTLSVQALYRVKANDGGSAYRAGYEKIPAEISANSASMNVASLYRHPLSETPFLEEELSGTHVLRGFVNSMHGAERAFDFGLYLNELPVSVDDGTLRISISSDTSQPDCWCCFDNFTLLYHGTTENAVGISDADPDATFDVYTSTGIRVVTAIRRADLPTLPAGLYIVGTRKVIVR